MDVGDHILGRPWLYNMNVTIYGKPNFCTSTFNGRKLSWRHSNQDRTNIVRKTWKEKKSLNLLRSKELEQQIEQGSLVVLVTQEVTLDSKDQVPPRETSIIDEFKDVFQMTSRISYNLCVIFNTRWILSQEQHYLTYATTAWIQYSIKSWGKKWLNF